MSRTSRRRDTKAKTIPGSAGKKKQQLQKYKYPRRSKHHRGLKPRLPLRREEA
jgi:hypothetical protein